MAALTWANVDLARSELHLITRKRGKPLTIPLATPLRERILNHLSANDGEESFGAIRDGGIYIPVRGWGDKPTERGIKIKPMMVSGVLERTEWLELLRNMVAAAEIKLRVVEEYAPMKAADTERALVAGSPRGRPVILF